ncbi:MAG: DUF177 domain-containing protein [Actinomycetota bacterium]|nr:DUF177 domain-containing protein [Actinomycetota bacterium]
MTANGALIEHVNELRRRPGSRRELHRSMTATGLRISTAGVREGAEVRIDGVLESIPSGIVLDGMVEVPWIGECRRCLTDIEGVITTEVRELFESRPTEGETWPLQGDELDLGPMVRDTVLLVLPLAPLCSSDCRGPAPDSFPAVASAAPAASTSFASTSPMSASSTSASSTSASSSRSASAAASGEDEVRDPRWAALDQLRTD